MKNQSSQFFVKQELIQGDNLPNIDETDDV
jgi:hypothetical protein